MSLSSKSYDSQRVSGEDRCSMETASERTTMVARRRSRDLHASCCRLVETRSLDRAALGGFRCFKEVLRIIFLAF